MSRAAGHPSYSMPSRLTPIHAVCSGREYQAFHCTPCTPSWTPIHPMEPLPNDSPRRWNKSANRSATSRAHSTSVLKAYLLLKRLKDRTRLPRVSGSYSVSSPSSPQAAGVALSASQRSEFWPATVHVEVQDVKSPPVPEGYR